MRKRNLSEFMCIEMLYDYKSEKLDALRTLAVEEGLESSPKVREELKKLNFGISYCDKLKGISVSEPLVELISDQPKTAEKIFGRIKWHRFPQPVRWALEAVVVAVAIALFVTQVPDLFKGEVVESDSVLVKKFDIVPPMEVSVETPEQTKEIKAAYQAPESVPMDLQPVDGTTKPIAVAAPAKVETLAVPIIASKEIPALLKAPTIEVAAPTQVIAPTPTTTQVTAVVPSESAPITKKGNAYVYRMTMYVDNVDQVTPEIVTLISTLGGEKAGEVELGWRRKGGSYFHFSVPQASSIQMQDGLKKYAPFNIIKSAHPRVMPEGTERYILWIEKKSSGEVPAQEPMEGSEETQSPGTTAPVDDRTQGTSQDENEAN